MRNLATLKVKQPAKDGRFATEDGTVTETANVQNALKKDKEGYSTEGWQWARKNNIISGADLAAFWEALANIGKRGYDCPRTLHGEYIIDTGSKLLFTNGDYKAPTLTQVLIFDDTKENRMEIAKRWIIDEEEQFGRHNVARASIEAWFRNGYFSEYALRNFQNSTGQNQRGKGANRQATAGGSGVRQNQTGWAATTDLNEISKHTQEELIERLWYLSKRLKAKNLSPAKKRELLREQRSIRKVYDSRSLTDSFKKDSEGNALDKSQVKFFQQTVARDAKGQLQVLLCVISDPASYEAELEGIGYHAGSRKQAQERMQNNPNARSIEVYTNITKPLRTAFDFRDWHGDYVAKMLLETEAFAEHSNRMEIEEKLAKIAEYTDLQKADTALRRYLQGLGFDGIAYEQEGGTAYIAFKANQIKDRENRAPSKGTDIRFSLKDTQTQKNTTEDGGVQYSLKLGGFADVQIKMQEELDFFDLKSYNNYIGIQKTVWNKLCTSGFVDATTNRRSVENADTGVMVEIGKDGIKETFGPGMKFEQLPGALKKLKLATIRSLPEIIRYGEVISADNANLHKKNSSVRYTYIEHPVTVDGKTYYVSVDIRRSPQTSKFWVHAVNVNKKGQTPEANSTSDESAINGGLTSNETIPQPEDSVKQHSLKGTENMTAEVEKLKKTSDGIKARFDPEKFHGISTAKLGAIASNVYRDYVKNQSADLGALKEILSGIFADAKEGTDWSELRKKAYSAASEILREAVSVNDDLHMAYKAMSKILRETGISLSENGLGTLTGYDGLQDFRRKHFGEILFKQDGILRGRQRMTRMQHVIFSACCYFDRKNV